MKLGFVNKEVRALVAGLLVASAVVAADDVVSVSAPMRAPVEIDSTAVKIDVAASVRDIDASLRKAVVTGGESDAPVRVAVAEKRARG